MASLAGRISAYNRRRKWRLFLATARPSPETRILDVGFGDVEYSPNDNFLEKHYPYPAQITALGLDAPRRFAARYPAVKAVTYDGGRFPFADRAFDVCWSNAVIEHVGDADRQVEFLREVRRVSKAAFLTTPNRLFPVEVHTRTPLLHLLPGPLFEFYLRKTGRSWACGGYMRLLSAGDLKELLRAAGIGAYRMVRNRIGGFTLDFVVYFGEFGAPDTR